MLTNSSEFKQAAITASGQTVKLAGVNDDIHPGRFGVCVLGTFSAGSIAIKVDPLGAGSGSAVNVEETTLNNVTTIGLKGAFDAIPGTYYVVSDGSFSGTINVVMAPARHEG